MGRVLRGPFFEIDAGEDAVKCVARQRLDPGIAEPIRANEERLYLKLDEQCGLCRLLSSVGLLSRLLSYDPLRLAANRWFFNERLAPKLDPTSVPRLAANEAG